MRPISRCLFFSGNAYLHFFWRELHICITSRQDVERVMDSGGGSLHSDEMFLMVIVSLFLGKVILSCVCVCDQTCCIYTNNLIFLLSGTQKTCWTGETSIQKVGLAQHWRMLDQAQRGRDCLACSETQSSLASSNAQNGPANQGPQALSIFCFFFHSFTLILPFLVILNISIIKINLHA